MIPGMPDYMVKEYWAMLEDALRPVVICPAHKHVMVKGICWECAEETFGYDQAIELFAPELRGVSHDTKKSDWNQDLQSL